MATGTRKSMIGQELSRNDRKALLVELHDWQTPGSMLQRAEDAMDRLDNPRFFSQAGLSFLREAWVGASFARLKFPDCRLRLPLGEWPDMEIDGEPPRQFEIVEALMPGRRRSHEYDQPAEWRDYPVAEWHKVVDATPAALKEAVQRKLEKNYRGGTCNLIVYLNVGATFGIRRDETISAINAVAEVGRTKFDEVFVLWNDEVFG